MSISWVYVYIWLLFTGLGWRLQWRFGMIPLIYGGFTIMKERHIRVLVNTLYNAV